MAFVRVKRRYDEDPFNSIVVSHKKLKTTGTNVSKDCVFQFATTLKTENENLSQILKDVQKGKSVKCLTKASKNQKFNYVVEHSKAERFKFVNTLRAVKQDTIPIEENYGENLNIKVVDFVKQSENSIKPLVDDEGISIDYVYDLYYALNNDDKSIDIQDIDSVHGLDSDKFYSICRNINNLSDDSSNCEDDDDSNDEGNWRNNYPDEDDMENSEEDANDDDDDDNDSENLAVLSKKWTIYSTSSSDNEDKYSDNEDNIDDYDLHFARYKERVKAEEHCFYNCVLSDISNESSDLDE